MAGLAAVSSNKKKETQPASSGLGFLRLQSYVFPTQFSLTVLCFLKLWQAGIERLPQTHSRLQQSQLKGFAVYREIDANNRQQTDG